MPDLSVKRTLVKSPPELWAEVSELESLARHLGEFGEIVISRLEPESTVAWEGEHARGTVQIEASGWGTKVTLSAEVAELEAPEAQAEPVAVEEPEEPEEPVAPEPEPVAEAGPEPEIGEDGGAADVPRQGFFARWLFRKRREDVAHESEPVRELVIEPEPVAEAEPTPEPDPDPEPEPDPQPDPEPDPPAEPVMDGERARAVLESVLDALGSAHHRPFSRG